MSSRLDNPDTEADLAIRTLLDDPQRTPFIVMAGAGSGKTTSLVKALAHIVENHGNQLLSEGRKLACITYTEVAAAEILTDVQHHTVAHVSTIHSFLWLLIKPFQKDIRKVVTQKIQRNIDEIEGKTYGPRTKQLTKDNDMQNLNKLKQQAARIGTVSKFTYGTGSNYGAGVLGHNDILDIAPELITEYPLLAQIVARKFPFIFVDESQDTFPKVVACLQKVQKVSEGKVTLGFFGDPMQKIYQTGIGVVPDGGDYQVIKKPENYRSSPSVLKLANAVRQLGDSLQQIPGGNASQEGEVHWFILSKDVDRDETLRKVTEWLDRNSSIGIWSKSRLGDQTKILTIVHRMAAERLGFLDLFRVFNDGRKSGVKADFREGTSWQLTELRDTILPLLEPRGLQGREVISILRQSGGGLSRATSTVDVKAALVGARAGLQEINEIYNKKGTIGEIFDAVERHDLVEIDHRLKLKLGRKVAAGTLDEEESSIIEGLRNCKIVQVRNYLDYLEEATPYSTQHGTKGAEFHKVITILDDESSDFNLYSFEKFLEIKDLSKTEIEKIQRGEETSIDRTRRLFYVCVTRAIRGLAIVLFADDIAKAEKSILNLGFANKSQIQTLNDLIPADK